MNVNEIIRILSDIRSKYNCFDAEDEECYRGLSEAIKMLSAQQWIPCSERLPKKEFKEQRCGTYLTTNGYGVVCMMNYEFEGDFGFIGWGTNRPYDLQIVAWMPLSEPWEGEQE